MIDVMEISERVEAGMAALDEFYERKDWVMDIDLASLHLESPTECVLGQMFGGNYVAGLSALGITRSLDTQASPLGFVILDEEMEDEEGESEDSYPFFYAALTGIWAEAINNRIRSLVSNHEVTYEVADERKKAVRGALLARV